jgi:DNA-binding transcriptional ArsR family regulator
MERDPFIAVADSRRRDLLARLARGGPASATSLARDLPVTRQAVLKHLGALEAAGLVARARDGREVRFQAVPAPLAEVARWIELVSDRWQAGLERMRVAVEEEERKPGRADARSEGKNVRAGGAGPRLRRVRDREGSRRLVHERRRGRR